MTSNMDRLIQIMATLRDPHEGCPWDVEQTFASIAPHTIEEAYEVADAIEHGDMAALEDELGDLLLQVVFHAQMARELGDFDFEAVAGAICDKLVRRHPHVFGDATVKDAETQTRAWEDQKAAERQVRRDKGDKGDNGPLSALDGVTVGLPALTRALKLQKRAARVGFDWHEAKTVLAKVTEEAHELADEMADGDPDRLTDELGDLLFTCVNLARKLGVDPESALRHGNRKFEGRFRRLEALLLSTDGKTPSEASLGHMEKLWKQVKKDE